MSTYRFSSGFLVVWNGMKHKHADRIFRLGTARYNIRNQIFRKRARDIQRKKADAQSTTSVSVVASRNQNQEAAVNFVV